MFLAQQRRRTYPGCRRISVTATANTHERLVTCSYLCVRRVVWHVICVVILLVVVVWHAQDWDWEVSRGRSQSPESPAPTRSSAMLDFKLCHTLHFASLINQSPSAFKVNQYNLHKTVWEYYLLKRRKSSPKCVIFGKRPTDMYRLMEPRKCIYLIYTFGGSVDDFLFNKTWSRSILCSLIVLTLFWHDGTFF